MAGPEMRELLRRSLAALEFLQVHPQVRRAMWRLSHVVQEELLTPRERAVWRFEADTDPEIERSAEEKLAMAASLLETLVVPIVFHLDDEDLRVLRRHLEDELRSAASLPESIGSGSVSEAGELTDDEAEQVRADLAALLFRLPESHPGFELAADTWHSLLPEDEDEEEF